jgi:hypothetical protein
MKAAIPPSINTGPVDPSPITATPASSAPIHANPEHYYRVHVAGPRRAPHGSKDVGESYARPDSERHTAEADEHDGRVAPSRSAKGAPG